MAATYTCDRCGQPATHLRIAVDVHYTLRDDVDRTTTAHHDFCDACVKELNA